MGRMAFMNSTLNYDSSDTVRRKVYITQKDIASMLETILSKMKLDNYVPDNIVGVSRGGLQIAVMLSHYFDVPCIPIASSSVDISNSGKYLVIDDDCSIGYTLEGIKSTFDAEENIDVKYAVLYYCMSSSVQPDYWAKKCDNMEDSSLTKCPNIVYPWEVWHMDQLRTFPMGNKFTFTE